MDYSKLSDAELIDIVTRSRPKPLPVDNNPIVDDIGVVDIPQIDYSAMSDDELMNIAGIQPKANPLQQAFDAKKSGLGKRINKAGERRFGQIQEIANQAAQGQIGDAEAMGRIGLKTAVIVPDIAGEVITSGYRALPEFIKNPIEKVSSNVYSAAASLPSFGGGTIGERIPQEVQTFKENNPVAAGRIGSVIDAGNLVAGFIPIGGTNAVRSSGKVGQKALTTTGKGVALATSPIRPALSKEAQLLQDLGVRLTSGQRGGGLARATENKATSIPIVGDAIMGAQKRGIEDFNRVITDDVLSSINTKLPKSIKTGNEAISHAYEQIGKSYDDALSKMTGVLDQNFDNAKISAYQNLVNLPTEKAAQTKRIIDNAINVRLSSGNIINGGDNKQIMRRLKTAAAKYSKSQDPDQQLMGEIIGDVHSAYSDMLQRNNPADLAQKLKDTDLAFAKYVRLEQAGVKGKEGIFTPSQLLTAVKQTDGSVRKGAFARGDSLLQDLATAGNNVLPNNIPDSGTAGRAIQNFGLGAILAGTAPINPMPLLAGGLAASAYTRPGQALLRGTSKAIRKKK